MAARISGRVTTTLQQRKKTVLVSTLLAWVARIPKRATTMPMPFTTMVRVITSAALLVVAITRMHATSILTLPSMTVRVNTRLAWVVQTKSLPITIQRQRWMIIHVNSQVVYSLQRVTTTLRRTPTTALASTRRAQAA